MAKKPGPFEDNLIVPDLQAQIEEFENGKPIGETARVPVITENFSWKRGFVNCWTGWPNDGKSTFLMFMMLMKSICDDWKWCIWSPEQYNASVDQKKLVMSAADIIDELIFMYTGRTPYKHFKQTYDVAQMSKDEYVQVWKWVTDHFVFITLKDRTFPNLLDTFRFYQDIYEFNGFVVDPWKNIDDSSESGRTDQFLRLAFSDTKAFSLETNSSFNIVAHPRADKDPKNPDGSYKVCTQFMLSGGSEWNNSMDGIYSISRTHKHRDPNDRRVAFFNLKQRKQQLVGKCGVYDKIEFDFLTNRYYFAGHCPIDGQFLEPLDVKEKRERAAAEAAKKNGEGPAKKKAEKAPAHKDAEAIPFTEVKVNMEEGSVHEPTF